MESECLCVITDGCVSKKKVGYDGFSGLTDDAPHKYTETELCFDLRPGDSFRLTSEHIPIDILTA